MATRRAWIAGCCVAGLLSPSVSLAELGFGVGYVGQYTDNIQLVEVDPEEEWTNIAIAGIAYRERGPELSADVLGQIEYLDYTREVYQDETLGYLSAAAVWSISPQRFLWTLVDRLDQLPQNVTDPLTPVNRDAVNAFETGPDLLMPLSPGSVLILGMRVGNTWFREGNADNNSLTGALRWRRQISPLARFSVNLEGRKIVHSEAPPSPSTELLDYDREDLYLRYDWRQPTSRFILDLGGTHIVPDGEFNDIDEPLARLNWARRLTSESAAGVSFGREVLSVSTALLAGVADPTEPEPITMPAATPMELATGAVYVSRRGEVFYNRTGHAFGLRVGLFQRDVDYLTTGDDRVETGSVVSVSYTFSPVLIATLNGGNLRTEFPDLDRLDRDIQYGLLLTYRINQHLSFGLEGSHKTRNSSDALASYDETRGLVRLMYSTTPLFAPAARR